MQRRGHSRFRSVPLHVDVSPDTGIEVLGMLMDMRVGGEHHSIILHGVTMAPGYTSTMNKYMSLLSSIWLVTGPSLDTMVELLGGVTYVTADQGTESAMCGVGHVLDAFAEKCGLHVPPRFAVRIFLSPDSVYCIDWDHISAGILKHAMTELHSYCARLAQMQQRGRDFIMEDIPEQLHEGIVEC